MSEAIVINDRVLAGEIRTKVTLSGSIVSEGVLKGTLSMPVG